MSEDTTSLPVLFPSPWGGDPETVTIDELVARWRPVAAGFDATQHLTGPIVVAEADGNRTTGVTTVRGDHHIVGDDGQHDDQGAPE